MRRHVSFRIGNIFTVPHRIDRYYVYSHPTGDWVDISNMSTFYPATHLASVNVSSARCWEEHRRRCPRCPQQLFSAPRRSAHILSRARGSLSAPGRPGSQPPTIIYTRRKKQQPFIFTLLSSHRRIRVFRAPALLHFSLH